MVRKVVVALLLALFAFAGGIPKSYYQIKDVHLQKERFFEILKPLVEEENRKILLERAFVVAFFAQYRQNRNVNKILLQRLKKIAKKYKIKKIFDETVYLKKIDAVPVSLVLAQAALESGWGKSRFAKEANNLFGEWTYGKRGLVPKHRKPGQKHKIKIFDSISDSIASYMLNLNRHPAYKEFRQLRFLARLQKRPFTGMEAAMTMEHYSGIGKQYNYLVQSIIKRHKLHKLEKEYYFTAAL